MVEDIMTDGYVTDKAYMGFVHFYLNFKIFMM